MNPPTIQHFLIVDFLDTVLNVEIKRLSLPWLCFSGTGVRTGRNKSRLTDLSVVPIKQARELMNVSAVFQSPPLLIIEVVSPESVKRDYRYKRSEYAALEVSEYWVVAFRQIPIYFRIVSGTCTQHYRLNIRYGHR